MSQLVMAMSALLHTNKQLLLCVYRYLSHNMLLLITFPNNILSVMNNRLDWDREMPISKIQQCLRPAVGSIPLGRLSPSGQIPKHASRLLSMAYRTTRYQLLTRHLRSVAPGCHMVLTRCMGPHSGILPTGVMARSQQLAHHKTRQAMATSVIQEQAISRLSQKVTPSKILITTSVYPRGVALQFPWRTHMAASTGFLEIPSARTARLERTVSMPSTSHMALALVSTARPKIAASLSVNATTATWAPLRSWRDLVRRSDNLESSKTYVSSRILQPSKFSELDHFHSCED